MNRTARRGPQLCAEHKKFKIGIQQMPVMDTDRSVYPGRAAERAWTDDHRHNVKDHLGEGHFYICFPYDKNPSEDRSYIVDGGLSQHEQESDKGYPVDNIGRL